MTFDNSRCLTCGSTVTCELDPTVKAVVMRHRQADDSHEPATELSRALTQLGTSLATITFTVRSGAPAPIVAMTMKNALKRLGPLKESLDALDNDLVPGVPVQLSEYLMQALSEVDVPDDISALLPPDDDA